jgi:5-methyltetrahydropteroyltriglutamate--homocysteine methyltransferase
MKTYAYGYPRIGQNREYGKVLEKYWQGELSEKELSNALNGFQKNIIETYRQYVDFFPVGEMTYYDSMFDTAIMLGMYKPSTTREYYDLCRGKNTLEMSKWFNTNYHYLIPDFSQLTGYDFSLHWNKPKEYKDTFNQGIPYIIGPFTFLKLSKGLDKKSFSEHLLNISNVYHTLLKGLDEIHIDEPAFAMELTEEEIRQVKEAYHILADNKCSIHLFTYYDDIDFLKDLYELPVHSIGLDFIHGTHIFHHLQKIGFPEEKNLIAGLVDGRNVWKTNINDAVETVQQLSKNAENIIISNAAPLYHLPISIESENLDERLLHKLSFAKERLRELKLIAQHVEDNTKANMQSNSNFGRNEEVQHRIRSLNEQDFKRLPAYKERNVIQQSALNLPLFPTTTIGSYPQTPDVRKARVNLKKGTLSEADYDQFIKGRIRDLIRFQEEAGLDVLVHGEFERSDMVEFFGQKLEGVATTKHGWILSYGSRGYRPPIIYGDVYRSAPMTLKEIAYAQSLTKKPVKGMITGPITIIAWSFVRQDIPVHEVAYQIALCLRDEVKDYEDAGIRFIQIDEPAFREKTPIKPRDWNAYFDWAIKSFRLVTSKAKPETQIHTHMCYSEFGEIIDKIKQMDFDVISIEAARSKGDIIESFETIHFERQIGLGVWDIHSPAVPSVENMKQVAHRALQFIPKENVWINPDCGLKTRGWPETKESLKNLVLLARELRNDTHNKEKKRLHSRIVIDDMVSFSFL